MKRGRTERETCDLNGWSVGTVLRGHEGWTNGAGCWTTIRITALGEDMILGRSLLTEITDNGEIVETKQPDDHEHSYTLRHRDWIEVAP